MEEELIRNIKNVTVQGATNVALAILDFLSEHPDKEAGMRLAYARPTEPLAQNAVRYVFAGDNVKERISQFQSMIENAKSKIAGYGNTAIKDGNTYLTHCHSSTVTSVLLAHKNCHVYATETRPLYQGRRTAKELLDGGLDVTMIVDSAAAYTITTKKVTAVLVGADVLSDSGFINKTGTLQVVLVANSMHIPVFVFATLLKYSATPATVEERSPSEIWPEAPSGLKFFAPAFDVTPYHFDVTLVTEAGLLQGDKLKETITKEYPWLIPTPTI